MNRLKQLREEKGLFQSDIGTYLGITGNAVGLYENEKRDIPTEVLKKLSDFFGVSIDYILAKSDKKIPIVYDYSSVLLQVLGLDIKKFEPPTHEQEKQIKDYAIYILKDNKKK